MHYNQQPVKDTYSVPDNLALVKNEIDFLVDTQTRIAFIVDMFKSITEMDQLTAGQSGSSSVGWPGMLDTIDSGTDYRRLGSSILG